jgi:hypothetical protein
MDAGLGFAGFRGNRQTSAVKAGTARRRRILIVITERLGYTYVVDAEKAVKLLFQKGTPAPGAACADAANKLRLAFAAPGRFHRPG